MAEEILTLAYESGINFFDTAEVYASGRWVVYVAINHHSKLVLDLHELVILLSDFQAWRWYIIYEMSAILWI